MNKVLKSLVAAGSAVLACSTLFALPPGPGSAHIRFSGKEVFPVHAPDYSTFVSRQTVSIPGLQIERYVLILDVVTTVYEWMGDGYYITGIGSIKSPDGSSVIGECSFVSRSHILSFVGDELLWTIDVSLAGVIWGGPLGGMVLTENIHGGNAPDDPEYSGSIEGFLMVPEFVDLKLFKTATD